MNQLKNKVSWKKLIVFLALFSSFFSVEAQRRAFIAINAPSELKVVASSGSLINISWKDNSPDEEGFAVEKKETGRTYWEEVGFVPANISKFQLGGCLSGQEYQIRLRAYKGSLFSDYTSTVAARTRNKLGVQNSKVIESSNQRQGESTFVKAKNGELHLYFGSFSGVGDRSKSRITRKVSFDNGKSWSVQEIIFEDDSLSLFHPSAIRLSKNIIGVAYSKKVMDRWEAQKVFRYSMDEGKTWSKEIRISDDSYPYTTGSHDRFVQLSNGRIFHMVHGRIPQKVQKAHNEAMEWKLEEGYGVHAYKEHPKGRQLGTDIYSTNDSGKTWYKVNDKTILTYENPYGLGEYGFYEASLVEWRPGHLAIFGRNATGFLYVSRSQDYGKTWNTPRSVGIQNPLAPIRVAKIPNSDYIVLLQCPHVDLFGTWGNGPRYILASRISDDGGLTWKNYKELEYDGIHHYAYPALLFDGGTAHLAYWKTTLENNKWKKIELAYRQEPSNWFITE
ncbi:exo-alpha-sialidase [Spongiimicrobium sp. 3-5]|uniref:exo-alpha-sialidase n=1 Tax=Spongiimicrobium sp. 3-5 TaxID=3332596 RepID=UPI00397EC982